MAVKVRHIADSAAIVPLFVLIGRTHFLELSKASKFIRSEGSNAQFTRRAAFRRSRHGAQSRRRGCGSPAGSRIPDRAAPDQEIFNAMSVEQSQKLSEVVRRLRP